MLSSVLDLTLVYLAGSPPLLGYVSYNPLPHQKDGRILETELLYQAINSVIASYDTIEYIILISRGPLYFSGKGFGIEEQDPNLNNWKLEPINPNSSTISNKDAFVDGYVKIVKLLLSKGKKVIFVIDFPELGIDPATCRKRKFSMKKGIANCLLDKNIVDARQREYRQIIRKMQQQVPSLIIYDPISAFCNGNICYGKRDEIIYYGDYDHLNRNGSELIGKHFKDFLLKQELIKP